MMGGGMPVAPFAPCSFLGWPPSIMGLEVSWILQVIYTTELNCALTSIGRSEGGHGEHRKWTGLRPSMS